MDVENATKTLAISVWFNLAWAACVFGPHWASIASLIVWLVIAYRCSVSITVIIGLAGTGLLMDSLLVVLGVYQFTEAVIPFWLIVLWIGFAVYLVLMQHRLNYIPSIWFAPILAVFAPLSYWVGTLTGKLLWPMNSFTTIAVVICSWLLYGLLLVAISAKKHQASIEPCDRAEKVL